jgi:hypothetical protein
MSIPTHRHNRPGIEEHEGSQEEEGTNPEEPCDDDLEIVEQSALDHFSDILQKAQCLATQAERERPRKCAKRYDGKSKRTLKRHKQHKEDLAKQGFLSVFEFLAYKMEKKRERAPETAVEMVTESEHTSESTLEDLELDTEALNVVFEHMGQVHCKEVLKC